MRLIDANELIEVVKGSEELLDFQKDELIACVDACDTAYDVEKVVEQIKREQYDITECSYERGFNAMARFAQKIVRKGGVE